MGRTTAWRRIWWNGSTRGGFLEPASRGFGWNFTDETLI